MQKTIFYNAQVVTMDDRNPCAQAVLIQNGRIVRVGTNGEILPLGDKDTALRDLDGCALLPGFIDPHSHFTAVAYSLLMVNARPSPAGICDTRELLLREFRRGYESGDWSDGGWLMGMGYDPAGFSAPVTRLDLDTVAQDVPVCCIHASGHMAVLNTLGLRELGYFGDFSVPQGGTVERFPDGTPSGLITERAYLAPEIQAKIRAPGFEKVLRSLKNTSTLYASYGITTAQDARVTEKEYALLTAGGKSGAIAIDVVGIAAPELAASVLNAGHRGRAYQNHIRMSGYKIFLDGSPQGKTAWLSAPYLEPPEGYGSDYRGFAIMDDGEVTAHIKTCLKNGWQLNAHCNGDEACEQLLRCYESAARQTGVQQVLRPVMIHAQTVRADQLDRMAKLSMTASFFLDHVYYWGDYYAASVLGLPRAENISPIRWALSRKLHCTLHQDSPVVPPNVLLTVRNAVCRTTMGGHVLGAHQRISVGEALKAVTLDGAYQIFEEQEKGSIAPGKRADLVILGENPMTCDSRKLQDIPVLETIKDGVTIYRKA